MEPKTTMTPYPDAIYGEIELPSYIDEIVSTPEFKRLKGIMQLGFKYQVFPEAQHNRYEHSIGYNMRLFCI